MFLYGFEHRQFRSHIFWPLTHAVDGDARGNVADHAANHIA